jgi:hypothetical protein
MLIWVSLVELVFFLTPVVSSMNLLNSTTVKKGVLYLLTYFQCVKYLFMVIKKKGKKC